METKKTRITLLFGGRSAEHDVSLISASSIYKNLDKDRYGVTCVYINKQGDWKIVPSPFFSTREMADGVFSPFLPWLPRKADRTLEADIYFPVLHGPYGEDGTIQGLLELADVPYVGAGVLGSAVGMDKAVMKDLFVSKGLPSPRYLVLLETDWTGGRQGLISRMSREFSLPIFVKPANLGSSVGITKVKTTAGIPAAVDFALSYDRKILIEEGIACREFECSVLGNDDPKASLPGEVIPYREFYDYEDKYLEGKTRFRIPADLPEDKTEEIRRLAVAAYKAVDCSGMARIDFFQEVGTGKFLVNEINTIPGFTEISMYPKLWEASGLSFPRLLDELIRLGFERHASKKKNIERARP